MTSRRRRVNVAFSVKGIATSSMTDELQRDSWEVAGVNGLTTLGLELALPAGAG